jgi:hypothetical protein
MYQVRNSHSRNVLPNVVFEWLTLLLRILETTGSNLAPVTDYPEVFRGFPPPL